MVLRSIKNIKETLPEVIHVVMFYNNGTVFQTTFEQHYNVPKLGEHLAEALDKIFKVYETCNFDYSDYKKLIFETDKISVMILKLGEDSNIALFFEKQLDIDQKLKSIRRYIKKIEELIDMDLSEIGSQEKEDNKNNLENKI
ncbi:MAG: hypothetical protein ACFFBP_18330 [Promethearchaeota archaeon]